MERLPDYDKRENDLREGKSRTAATAVIVGEVGDRSAADLEEFPSDVAGLLGFATGSEGPPSVRTVMGSAP